MARRGSIRERLRSEDGFTLPELMVVVALLPIVVIAMLKVLDTSAQIAPRSIELANAVSEADNGMSRLIRDLRQAYRIVGTTPNTITFNAVFNGVDVQVAYACDMPAPATSGVAAGTYNQCVRVTAPIGGILPSTSTGEVVVRRLLNNTAADPGDPVFRFAPDAIFPTYVGVQIKVPARGEDNKGTTRPIVITNGTLLRNSTLGS